MKSFKKHIIVLLIILGLLLLAGCSDQDWMDLLDIGKMWAQEHDLIDESGSPNYMSVVTRSLGGSTGDPQADAVLDAGMVVHNFSEAEKLSAEGFKERDINKVNRAISKRPGEFRYRNQKGSFLYFQGKHAEAEKEFANASNLASKYDKSAKYRNINSRIDYLKSELLQYMYGNDSKEVSDEEYNKNVAGAYKILSDSYYESYQISNNPADKESYESYKQSYELFINYKKEG